MIGQFKRAFQIIYDLMLLYIYILCDLHRKYLYGAI